MTGQLIPTMMWWGYDLASGLLTIAARGKFPVLSTYADQEKVKLS